MCNETCSNNCLDQICHQMTGNCLDCNKTHFGVMCEEECSYCGSEGCDNKGICKNCENGKYGEKCEKNCGIYCKNNACNIDGTCECQGGYGDKCEDKCPDNCLNDECDKDGLCILSYLSNAL